MNKYAYMWLVHNAGVKGKSRDPKSNMLMFVSLTHLHNTSCMNVVQVRSILHTHWWHSPLDQYDIVELLHLIRTPGAKEYLTPTNTTDGTSSTCVSMCKNLWFYPHSPSDIHLHRHWSFTTPVICRLVSIDRSARHRSVPINLRSSDVLSQFSNKVRISRSSETPITGVKFDNDVARSPA